MPSEPVLDFTTRAHLSEWMDEPCRYEDFRACLVSLRQSNRLTFNYRPTMQWLDQFHTDRCRSQPVRHARRPGVYPADQPHPVDYQ